MTRLRLVLLAATAVVAAACSPATVTPAPSNAPAPSTASASFAPINACSLVPDMDTIVGKAAVVAPAEFSIGPLSRCTWVYGTDPSRHVGLNVGPTYAHTDSIASFGGGEIVEGLGDDARWWEGSRTLSVEIGDRSFQVNLELEPSAVSKDLAVAIAKSALGHLG